MSRHTSEKFPPECLPFWPGAEREEGRTVVEESPVASSGSNGVVERAVQGLVGQIRAIPRFAISHKYIPTPTSSRYGNGGIPCEEKQNKKNVGDGL